MKSPVKEKEKSGSSHLSIHISLMANTELHNVSMDSIEDLTAVNVLDDIIINAINTIRKNKKRPDETSIYEFLNKNLENANLTKITINERLTSMSNNNRITNKLNNGKNSYFVANNESPEPKEDVGKQLLTNIETPPPKKDPIADISDKLENLQNFFIHELSDVRAEIKSVTCSKIPDLTENKLSNNIDLLEKQISFLKEECQNKNLIINILLEQLFHTNTSKSINTDNLDKSTKTVPDDCYEYPKKPAKTSKLKDQRKTSVETTNRFSILTPNEIPTDSTGKDSSLEGACERSIQTDDSNSNNRTNSHRKSNKTPRKNKLPVTVILGDSIVKDVKGWKLSEDKNKVVVKHFSGAKTKDMESYIIPTLEQNPETIIIHSGTNDLKSDISPEEIAKDIIKLTTSCKTQTNKVILSSIVPRYDNLNEKATRVNKCLKKECEARNICFIDHRNISPKYNCNRSGLHLNYSGTKKLIESILFCLCKSD